MVLNKIESGFQHELCIMDKDLYHREQFLFQGCAITINYINLHANNGNTKCFIVKKMSKDI